MPSLAPSTKPGVWTTHACQRYRPTMPSPQEPPRTQSRVGRRHSSFLFHEPVAPPFSWDRCCRRGWIYRWLPRLDLRSNFPRSATRDGGRGGERGESRSGNTTRWTNENGARIWIEIYRVLSIHTYVHVPTSQDGQCTDLQADDLLYKYAVSQLLVTYGAPL